MKNEESHMRQRVQKREYPTKKKSRKTYEKVLITLATICLVAAILIITVLCLLEIYQVKTVYVEGNVHYSSSEIRDMIMVGDLGDNSIYLLISSQRSRRSSASFLCVFIFPQIN